MTKEMPNIFSPLRAVLATLIAILYTPVMPASDLDAQLQVLRDLSLENGKILSVEHTTDSTITIGEKTFEKLPPRTIVRWELRPASTSHIRAEMWLPDTAQWNDRFLGLGNSGAAGSINSANLIGPIRGHFAVATTDLGTSPGADSGIGNPEVWKDFGHRATHLMTVSAKQILGAYYGRPPQYSYFVGGSTGGQQSMQEAQRYPGDYDGIVAHIPAHCRTPLHAYFLWNVHILSQCHFTDSQEANIIAAANEYMAPRESPAIAGKFISDPRATASDIGAVIDLAKTKDPTITSAQAESLRKLFDGPTHPVTGERIFGGIPLGSPLSDTRGHLYLFQWVFGRDRDLRTIDFAEDIDTYTAALGPQLNAENPDLRPFRDHGGKLLIIPGTADSIVPYYASIDYYERLIATIGSLDQTRDFARLFIIPGMGHGPGPGINQLPDTLKLVMDWREKGTAPDRLLGKRVTDGKTELELPIYPYPTQAKWDSNGQTYHPIEGPRAGVPKIAPRYLPAAN